MKGEARNVEMARFSSGQTQLLVATTVIEAASMCATPPSWSSKKAERFGLSQLHQLRGRVGRSDCLSLRAAVFRRVGEVAKSRLSILRESEDGFNREVDFKLARGGDCWARARVACRGYFTHLFQHINLLQHAREDIRAADTTRFWKAFVARPCGCCCNCRL